MILQILIVQMQFKVSKSFFFKSLMYFYEEGECILNNGMADDAENSITEEKVDKVLYLENGCGDHGSGSKRNNILRF